MSAYEFLTDLAKRDIKLWVEGGRLRCNAPQGVLTADIRAQLAQRKAEIIAFLEHANLAPHVPKIEPVPRTRKLPLSFAQQRLWFLNKLEGGASYNIPTALQLQGTLQIAVLEQALNQVVERHEVLRTRFQSLESPVQVIEPDLKLTLPIVEVPLDRKRQGDGETASNPSPSPSSSLQEVQQLIQQEAQTPFDLEKGPLLRVKLLRLAPQKHILLLTIHHIIADGWSLGILVRELSVFYRAFSADRPSPLPPLRIQYADFAVWQRQYLEGEILATQLNYWKQQLAGAPPLLELPTNRPRSPVQSFSGSSESFTLGKDLTQKLLTLSQQTGTTLFATLLAAFGILLSRYSRQEELVIGSPIANRNRQELEPLVGFFANTLALRLNLKGNPSFREFLGQVRQISLDAYAHQDLPFERLVEELHPQRSLSHSPLFQVMFALQNAPLGEIALPGLSLKVLETESVTTKFDLTLALRETEFGLEGKWEYSSDLFEAATIRQMIGHYQTLLAGIVAHPEERVANLPLLGEAEQQLLGAWRVAEAEEYPKFLHQLFEEQVEQTPDAVALISYQSSVISHQSSVISHRLSVISDQSSVVRNQTAIAQKRLAGQGDNDVEEVRLTYRQLNACANQLAHYLQALGVGPEVQVGICARHSIETVVGLLGILKAGGAYLPLDPEYPQEYLKKILAATNTSIALSQPELRDRLLEPLQLIELDLERLSQYSQENPNSEVTSESIACVIYSAQKGISVSHKAMSYRLHWLQKIALSHSDVVLNQAPLAQETGVWNFVPLTIGGRLAIAPEDNPAALERFIVEQQVSTARLTPSALSALEALPEVTTHHLRRVFCDGVNPKVVQRFHQQLSCSLYHLYSFPETGEIACRDEREETTELSLISLSCPRGASIYVLDEQLQPVPTGVTGEICVGGIGLARGYVCAPEETARRFVDRPSQGTRLFKTGEWGRILDRGLERLGSREREVSINGVRVSLPEVEAALLKSRSLHDCRVLMREETIPRLVAYIVPASRFSLEQLQSQARSLLPTTMLPSAYVPLSALPLTSAGQVDEQALQQLPVIDADLVQRWEEQLHSHPEIEQVAVVVQQPGETIPPVHLSDLLEAPLGEGRRNQEEGTGKREEETKKEGARLAVSYGGALRLEVDAPFTLAQALQRAASDLTKGITYIRCDGSECFQSYQDLLAEAQRILAGLRKLGLKPQAKVIFQLERLQDFIPAFWGCILGGFIPVPISVPPTYEQANSAASKLRNAWQLLGKPLVLTRASSVSNLRLKNFPVEAIEDLRASEPDTNWHLNQPDDLAILLLTSGSTGTPKAVMQSHRSILSRSAATAIMNKFTNNDVSLNWFPLDHVGGLVMFHLRDVYLGCQQIQAPIQLVLQQPLLWLDWIERYRATLTWAPNFAYGAVVAQAGEMSQRKWDLSSMRFILNGGEAIAAKSARRFLELLAPHQLAATAMYPAWGMSETCSGVVYSHSFSLDSTTDEQQTVEVGAPIPGIWIRIADEQQAIAEGKIGRVQVKGLSVTSGYYQNPKLNQEAFTDDGWFKTGDLGLLREGRLTITGREKDVIIINGINYYAPEIEATVEEIEGVEVSYTAAVAVRDPQGNTDQLIIFFTPTLFDETKLTKLIKAIRTQVVQNVGINPNYLIPLEKESIPKTSIGKIGRSQLSKRFEAGEFDALTKRLDILLENANTLPNWFYRQVWQPKVTAASLQTLPTVVFLDSLGLGAHLCHQFKQRNQACIQVEAGKEFIRFSDRHYRLNPDEPEHYYRLFVSLATDNFPVAQILHLWTYDEAAETNINKGALQGTDSLLFLVQALDQKAPVRLQVVSSYSQQIESGDRVACQKAPLLGLLKTVAQEMPWLTCRHIDLNVESVESNAALILQELSDLSGEPEVAYRNGQRLVARLELADLAREDKQPLPFRKGGLYLISGGLGGIGAEIAQYLLKHYQAKLLLVGRTPLEHSEGLNTYRSLKQLGGEVCYEAVDICDRPLLQQVVERTQTEWGGNLDGVIHLAGVFQERLLEAETSESIKTVLRPKLLGTWILHQLLLEQGGVFISFSSVNGLFGGTGVGAYAAANRFLDCFTRYLRYQTPLQSYCFAWSMWEETGMSRGYQFKELTRDRGFSLLSPQQGLHSFLAGLHHNQAPLWIGLNGYHPHLRRIINQSYPLQQLTAYLTSAKGAGKGQSNEETRDNTLLNNLQPSTGQPSPQPNLQPTQLPKLAVDRFGTSTGTLIELQEMPLTAAGAIDRQLLVGSAEPQRDRSQPQTEVARKIANIWQAVLKVPSVSAQDNFFELGGHSLLATQVVSRLREAFGVELPLSCLFASPTVEGLSQQVESLQQEGLKQQRITPIERERNLPLSFAQQRLWFLEQLEGNSITYNLPAALRLSGTLNRAALEQSLQEIVARHEVLRTCFPMVEGSPVQAIASFQLTLPVIELQPEAEHSGAVQQLVDREAQTPFDLEKGPLLRVKLVQLTPQKHVLLLTMHHIIADGWSLGILVREVSVLYQAFCAGSRSPLPPLPIQYADFAVWQRQYLAGDVLETQLEYWKHQLAGAPPLLELPTDHPRLPVQTFSGGSESFALGRELTQKLLALSQHSGTSLFMTLLAAFAILLSRYTRQTDLVIGSPIANRNRQEIEPLIGFFVNTLALRFNLQANPSFQNFLEQVRQMTLEAYAHQDLPFERLVEELQPERNLSHSPLFQVMFALQNAPFEDLELPGLSWTTLETQRHTTQFDLFLSLREGEAGLEGVWEYNSDLFDAATIRRAIEHYRTLLEGIVANPEQPVANLPLLTPAQRQQLVEWNATEAEYPEQCIHQLFEEQVHKTPDAIAAVWEDQSLTYRQLNARANQLAHYLQKLGVGPEVLVGICVERSLEMLVGVLGILKAGGAYVPLDPTYPNERLEFMLADTQVMVLLTQQRQLERFSADQGQKVCLDADWERITSESEENLSHQVQPDNSAYIIYTSGSTGVPKGVEVLHRGVVRLVCGVNYVRLDESVRMLQMAPIAFDASTFEIWGALLNGGCCVLLAEATTPKKLGEAIEKHGITTLWLTAALFNTVVDQVQGLRGISQLLVGGEALSVPHIRRALAALPDTQIINGYGPTESTTFACSYSIPRQIDHLHSIPIGRPIADTQIYLLDRHLQPVPIGVAGELYLGGAGLARGYLNRPELTQEKFIPNPFQHLSVNLQPSTCQPSTCQPSTQPPTLYKTGDLARYLPDGNIEYLGRIDNQVKLRGFRIEPGEIEAVLTQHPQVQQATVVVQQDIPGKRLVAYTVGEIATRKLRSFLQGKLPEYMLPSAFVQLEAMPLTPNGKLDRRALPMPERTKANLVMPRTSTQATLAAIWAEVLGLEQVGIYDNFFELGGDSILSIQVVSRANESGLKLSPKQIFQHQTIAELAAVAQKVSISSQQGLVTGPVPLTPVQHWFFEQHPPQPHHFNQAVLLEIDPSVKPELLQQSVGSLLEHHDALRLRFEAPAGYGEGEMGRPYRGRATLPLTPQSPSPNRAPFQVQDLSSLTPSEQQESLEAIASDVQASLNLQEGPLMQAVLFHLGNKQPSRLLLVIHHLAVDGVSWRILLEDLTKAYQQLDRGEAIQLPPKTTSFQEWAKRLQEYGRAPALAAELDYWLAQLHEATPLSADILDRDSTVANRAIATVSLTEAETRTLLQDVPSVYNTQINDVLLTALMLSADWPGDSLLVDLEGHGREELFETVDLSRTVGWFTSIFPVRLHLESRSDLGVALKSIKEQLRRIPKRGIGYGLLRYLSQEETRAKLEALPAPQVSFNYLGQFEKLLRSPPLLGVAQESVGQERSPLQKRSHPLEINSFVTNNKLQISWTYGNQQAVERLAKRFLEALRSLIAHCQSPEAGGYTPSDFAAANLNQKQLDRFVNKLKKR